MLPPLTPDQRTTLKQSIQQRLLDCPIIKDEDGEILDGQHRLAVLTELGVKDYPVVTKDCSGLSAQERKLLTWEINCQRRVVDRKTMQSMIDSLLCAMPNLTDRYIGHVLFCNHETVGRRRQLLIAREEIAPQKKLIGRDGRQWKHTSVHTLTTHEAQRAHDDLETLDGDGQQKPVTYRKLKTRRVKVERARREAEPVKGYRAEHDIKLYHCDMRVLADKAGLKPASVPLIMTDPLYEKKALPEYAELGKFAKRYLVPGGFLACYCGNNYIPEIMDMLRNAGLTYHWLGVNVFDFGRNKTAGSLLDYQRRMINGFRVVLLFTNGKSRRLPNFVCDRCMLSSALAKDWHPYQQCLAGISYWVRHLSFPGELVIDPFMGSGTCAVACRRLQRRFIGCDIDIKAFQSAQKRLVEEQKRK